MKIWDVLWKQSEDRNGKARWERIGVLLDRDGRLSLKLDLMPISKDWDGWLVVSERREKDEPF